MSIVLHPIWPKLQPYVRIEADRISGYTLAVVTPVDPILLRQFLNTFLPCAFCGMMMRPIRRQPGHDNVSFGPLYLSASCGLDSCNMSADVRDEVDAIRKAIAAWRRPGDLYAG